MYKQRYTKHCTETQRLSNTNNIKQTEVSSGASEGSTIHTPIVSSDTSYIYVHSSNRSPLMSLCQITVRFKGIREPASFPHSHSNGRFIAIKSTSFSSLYIICIIACYIKWMQSSRHKFSASDPRFVYRNGHQPPSYLDKFKSKI